MNLNKIQFNINDIEVENIQGQVALVTGGSRGIGKSVASKFRKLGLQVIIASRNSIELNKTAKEIDCVAFPLDVSNENDVKNMFKNITGKYGEVDIVVSNAGYIKPSPISNTETNEWKKHIDVNLTGTFYLAREFLNQQINDKKHFITVSSTSGMEGREDWSAYCASKAGVINFSESLAKEGKNKNIKVFDVAPSRTATKMREELFPDEEKPDMNQPDDVAKLIVYCCSELNNYPSGTSLWIEKKQVKLWKQ